MTIKEFSEKHQRRGELWEVVAIGKFKQIKIDQYAEARHRRQVEALQVLKETSREISYCDPFIKGAGKTATIWRAEVDFMEAMEALQIGTGQSRKFTL